MDLWTEFEGVTIDSAYALTKLVQTEGRSAFFSTCNVNGESVLIRIIECHFDEDEILARWRGVQSLGHPNFLRIDRFGQFHNEAEDTTAVYAVFEHVDANLGEVLQRGRLSATDATDIGISVCSVLETLHAIGFVHEHIETRNIYAAGNTVKLRSDCIRETPEGEAGMEARRRDVHDLAAVLKEVLLGTGASEQNLALLPAPFDEIVRNGMNGSWGLAEIKATLSWRDLRKGSPKRTTPPTPVLTRTADAATQPASPTAPPSTSEFSALPLPFDQPTKPEPLREWSTVSASNSATQAELPRHKPEPMELPVIFGISEHDFRKWMAAGALLLGIAIVGWLLFHHQSGHRASAAGQSVNAQSAVANSQTVAGPHTEAALPASGSPVAAPALKPSSQDRAEWRVVAFTYKRQDQAQKKVLTLAHQYPTLRPAIFSPTGKAPWFVTIGGVLQRDAAYALAHKARSLGLPHDTYASRIP